MRVGFASTRNGAVGRVDVAGYFQQVGMDIRKIGQQSAADIFDF
jgi:hypothetical protein